VHENLCFSRFRKSGPILQTIVARDDCSLHYQKNHQLPVYSAYRKILYTGSTNKVCKYNVIYYFI
jgi:hypothetical protein